MRCSLIRGAMTRSFSGMSGNLSCRPTTRLEVPRSATLARKQCQTAGITYGLIPVVSTKKAAQNYQRVSIRCMSGIRLQQYATSSFADVSSTAKEFRDSRWFTRGWTLQELLAPYVVKFYDQHWTYIGCKDAMSDDSLSKEISSATGIRLQHLYKDRNEASIAQRIIGLPQDKREGAKISHIACLDSLM